MIRFVFLALFAILCFGCSSPQKANNAAEPMPHSRLDDHVASKCYEQNNDEYVCDEWSPTSATDIKSFPGYHVIAFFKTDKGVTLAHVADECQHYFCAVETPASETQCKQPMVRTVGCCLAHVPHLGDKPSK